MLKNCYLSVSLSVNLRVALLVIHNKSGPIASGSFGSSCLILSALLGDLDLAFQHNFQV